MNMFTGLKGDGLAQPVVLPGCDSCQFGQVRTTFGGRYCQRNAPGFDPRQQDLLAKGERHKPWPVVEDRDWCGQFDSKTNYLQP